MQWFDLFPKVMKITSFGPDGLLGKRTQFFRTVEEFKIVKEQIKYRNLQNTTLSFDRKVTEKDFLELKFGLGGGGPTMPPICLVLRLSENYLNEVYIKDFPRIENIPAEANRKQRAALMLDEMARVTGLNKINQLY